ncbi:MAG: DMT family transporter [bacterium]|nr:DMT family transporter [bacterium]
MSARSVFYLGLYALMLAMGHVLQKVVLNHGVDPVVFSFLRILTGFLLITILMLMRKHRPVRLIKENIRVFLVLGIGYSGIGFLTKMWGLSLTTATNTSFIISLSSVALVVFAFFLLKEKVPKRFYVIMTMMIGGVYLVTTGGKQLTPRTGDVIILMVAFLIGFMDVYGKRVLRSLSVLQTAFGRSFIGMVFLGVLIPLFSPGGFSTIESFPVLLLVIANGIIFSGSVIFFYKALQVEGASSAGTFSLLAPLLTVVMGYFLLSELLNAYQVLGGVVILTGSFLISRLKVKQANV